MFQFNNHHQGAYYWALLKLQFLNVIILIIITLAKHNNKLPDDGC
jgi:heme exporter protein D